MDKRRLKDAARLRWTECQNQLANLESLLIMATGIEQDAETNIEEIKFRAEAAERQVAELKREIGERDTAIDRLKARVEITESTEDAALQEAISCGREAERLKWSKEVAALRAQLQEAQRVTVLHLASEYHEDMGSVLWWRLPICEPPIVDGYGVPDGWTHFSRMPIVWDGDGSALKLSDAARSEGGSTKGTAHSADAEGARNASDLGGDSREER